MELTDKYQFGKPMHNGSIPVLKNGENAACVRNIDMVVPCEIKTNLNEEVGGKIIKAPCIRQCMALKEGVATLKATGVSQKVYVMSCIEQAGFIKIADAPETKTKSLIL